MPTITDLLARILSTGATVTDKLARALANLQTLWFVPRDADTSDILQAAAQLQQSSNTTQVVLVHPNAKYKSIWNAATLVNHPRIVSPGCAGLMQPSGLEIPARMPGYYDLQYTGALVAIRVDDGNTNVMNGTDSLYGNTTFAKWLFRNGIPATISVIPSQIGQTGYLSASEIAQLVLNYGWEMCSHSWYHDTGSDPDVDWSRMVKELSYSKRYLETMTVTDLGTPQDRVGAMVRGFVQPETWNGTWYNTVEWNSITGKPGAESPVARSIAMEYEWSHGYYPLGSGLRLHFFNNVRRAQPWNSSHFPTNTSDYEPWLRLALKPGVRIGILIHDPLNSTDKSKIASLIQALINIRNSPSGVPVEFVTLSGLHLGRTAPFSTSHPLPLYWEGFETWQDANESTTGISYGVSEPALRYPHQLYKSYTGDSFTLQTSGGLAPGSKYLSMTLGAQGSSHTAAIYVIVDCLPPGQYSLECWLKRPSGTAVVGFSVGHYNTQGKTFGGNWLYPVDIFAGIPDGQTITPTTSWAKYTRTFTVPTWASGPIRINIIAYGDNSTIDVDNIGIRRL